MIYYNCTSCVNVRSLLVHEKGGSTMKIDPSYAGTLEFAKYTPRRGLQLFRLYLQ